MTSLRCATGCGPLAVWASRNDAPVEGSPTRGSRHRGGAATASVARSFWKKSGVGSSFLREKMNRHWITRPTPDYAPQKGLDEAQWLRPDEDGSHNRFIGARRRIETRREIHACRVLLGKETEKETTLTRTWRIETRKQTSLVSPSKCSKLLLISCSVPGNGFPSTTSGLPLRRPRRNNTGSG